MNKISWEIIGSLFDDYESFEQIYYWISNSYPNISKKEVLDSIIKLYELGYITTSKKYTSPFNVKKEIEYDYLNIDFGLTIDGVNYWDENAEKNGCSKIDWSTDSQAHLNYIEKKGWVYGATQDVCVNELNQMINLEKDIIIKKDSVQMREVDKFESGYYKKIIYGGYIINFRFEINEIEN